MKLTWDHVRYRLDRVIARGPRMLLFLHFVVSAVVLLVTAIIAWRFTLFETKGRGLIWTLWFNTVLALDPGTAADVKDDGTHQLVSVIVVAVIGLIIVGSLIALIHNAVEHRVEQMRKGTVPVTETGHVVVIGWSRQTFLVVRNLLADRPHTRIVILADRGRVEMEDELRARLRRPPKHRAGDSEAKPVSPAELRRIICRTGNPIDPEALRIVSPETASSIIVVSPDVEHPDAHVVKILLALVEDLSNGQRHVPIVAQLLHSKNLKVAEEATNEHASVIATSGLVARALVQASRQSGLTEIINDLVSPGKNDVHFLPQGRHDQQRFGDVLNRFQEACVVGIYEAPTDEGMIAARRSLKLNPDPETILKDTHGLVVISRREGEPEAAAGQFLEGDAISVGTTITRGPERTLILGWSQKVRRIVKELCAYAEPGSSIRIVADNCRQGDAFDITDGPMQVAVVIDRGDPTDRHHLDDLDLATYHHVIVVACSDDYETQYADARTIMTLLHLRDIARTMPNPFTVAAEILDASNRSLACVAIDDRVTIIDDEFVGLMLTRIAADSRLYAIIADLFDSEGSEIYFKPACEYVAAGRRVTFATIVEAARRRGETAIGVQQKSCAAELNPSKSATFEFESEDRIVVLAES
jgi:spore maturation protein SpmA